MRTEKKAVILAAGAGRRMGEAGKHLPKPMTAVGGTSIIGNAMEQLCASGFTSVVVVTGYKADILEEHLKPFSTRTKLVFVRNPDFATTNNIYSLWLARAHLASGFHLVEADVMFDSLLLKRLDDCRQEDVMIVDRFTDAMNGTVVSLDGNGTVTGMYLSKEQGEGFRRDDKYKTVNIYRFSASYASGEFVPGLDRKIAAGDLNSYYEIVVRDSVAAGTRFHGLIAAPAKWWEIDTPEDAAIAARIFSR